MIEFYAQIKLVHIALAIASGSLFALRGALVQWGRPAPAMAAPVRYLSYSIDTALLTAAMMLLTLLPGAVFANGWLAVKIFLLVLYVVLGTYALKRGHTRRIRAICYVSALLVFACLASVARAHHPLGFLAGLNAPAALDAPVAVDAPPALHAPAALHASVAIDTPTAALPSPALTRFATDPQLREGMARIRQSVQALDHSRHGHLQAAQVQALAAGVRTDVGFIFVNCHLPPAADQALHGILAALLKGSTALSAKPGDPSPVAGMERALAQYDATFTQPAGGARNE